MLFLARNGFGFGLEVVLGVYSKMLLVLLVMADFAKLHFINTHLPFIRTYAGRGLVEILWVFEN
jgi:hypothetical protein